MAKEIDVKQMEQDLEKILGKIDKDYMVRDKRFLGQLTGDVVIGKGLKMIGWIQKPYVTIQIDGQDWCRGIHLVINKEEGYNLIEPIEDYFKANNIEYSV